MKFFLGLTVLLSCEAVKAKSARAKAKRKYWLNSTIFTIAERKILAYRYKFVFGSVNMTWNGLLRAQADIEEHFSPFLTVFSSVLTVKQFNLLSFLCFFFPTLKRLHNYVFLIQPIRSLLSGLVIAVAVIPNLCPGRGTRKETHTRGNS